MVAGQLNIRRFPLSQSRNLLALAARPESSLSRCLNSTGLNAILESHRYPRSGLGIRVAPVHAEPIQSISKRMVPVLRIVVIESADFVIDLRESCAAVPLSDNGRIIPSFAVLLPSGLP